MKNYHTKHRKQQFYSYADLPCGELARQRLLRVVEVRGAVLTEHRHLYTNLELESWPG